MILIQSFTFPFVDLVFCHSLKLIINLLLRERLLNAHCTFIIFLNKHSEESLILEQKLRHLQRVPAFANTLHITAKVYHKEQLYESMMRFTSTNETNDLVLETYACNRHLLFMRVVSIASFFHLVQTCNVVDERR